MTTTENLDNWRWSQAMNSEPDYSAAPRVYAANVVDEYRRLVNDDVRPNPVPVFPEAVQEAEKTIVYMMEEMPTAEYLARLPHVLSMLYERGMRDATQGSTAYSPEGASPKKEDCFSFAEELANLINRHSMENESGTPDFILGTFLADVLRVFVLAVRHRDAFGQIPMVQEGPDVEEARDTTELDARDILSEIGHWIRQYEDLNFAVNVPTTPEQQDDFNRKLSAHYESRAPRHPIRRHLDAVRSRQEVVRDAFEYRHGEQSAERVVGDS